MRSHGASKTKREELNKKILGTQSERVKKQLRAKCVEKNREVKRSIKTDKKKWMENIRCEAEEAARNQHMKTLYGSPRYYAMKNLSRAELCWIKMETFSIKKKKYRHDGWSTLKKYSMGVNKKTQS